jgi:hypothetical protein
MIFELWRVYASHGFLELEPYCHCTFAHYYILHREHFSRYLLKEKERKKQEIKTEETKRK